MTGGDILFVYVASALLTSLMFGVAGGLIILGVWFPGELVNLHYE